MYKDKTIDTSALKKNSMLLLKKTTELLTGINTILLVYCVLSSKVFSIIQDVYVIHRLHLRLAVGLECVFSQIYQLLVRKSFYISHRRVHVIV